MTIPAAHETVTVVQPRFDINPKDRALQVLAQYAPKDDQGNIILPVDPYKIAIAMDANLYESVEFPAKTAGVLYKKDAQTRPEIVLNAFDGIPRKRFTVAHEIGHLSEHIAAGTADQPLGFVENRDELSSAGTDPSEVAANQFAAELLMPEQAVRKFVREGFSFSKLRDIFNVSQAALGNRLDHLNIQL